MELQAQEKSAMEVVEDAISQVETYKNPDLTEFMQRFGKMLNFVHKGFIVDGVHNDTIVEINLVNTPDEGRSVLIKTEWYARGCHQTSEYTTPLHLFLTEDPVKAARFHVAESEVKSRQRMVEMCTRNLQVVQDQLTAAQTLLDQVRADYGCTE